MKMERQIIFQNSEHSFEKWGRLSFKKMTLLFIYFFCLQYTLKANAQTLGNSCPTNGVIAAPAANGNAYLCTSGTWGPTLLFSTGTFVGIGTTNPTNKLVVAGTIQSSSGGYMFPDGSVQTTSATGSASQWTTSGTNIYYNNGNVGIGTTSPTQALEVVGAAKATTILAGDGSATSPSVTFGSSTNTGIYNGGAAIIRFSVGGTERAYLNSSGLVLNSTKLQFGSNGTAAAPLISYAGASTTGLYFPTSNTIGFSVSSADAMRIDSTGNVGIGTTSPNMKLDIRYNANNSNDGIYLQNQNNGGSAATKFKMVDDSSSSTLNLLLYGSGTGINAGQAWILTEGATQPLIFGTAGVEKMRITSAGNVGIGTKFPDFTTGAAATYHVLGVNGDGSGANSAGILMLGNSRTTATTGDHLGHLDFISQNNLGYQYGASIRSNLQGSGGANGLGGNLSFWSKADNTASLTERMRITDSGNVGIGISSPTYMLSVAGTIQSSVGGFRFPDGSVQTTSATAGVSQWTTTGTNIYYNNGFVGLGTNAPSSLLHLTSNNSGGTALRLENTDTGGRTFKIWSTGSMAASGTGRLEIYDTTANASRMLINAIGNVGIGATNPIQKLEVVGNSPGSQIVTRIANTSGTVNSQAVLSLDTTNNGFNVRDSQIRATNNGSNQTTLEFYTANANTPTEAMRITNTGNVGIGTITPVVKLDVSGAMKLGNDTSSCDSSRGGTLKWTGTFIMVCDGSTWKVVTLSNPAPNVVQTGGVGTNMDVVGPGNPAYGSNVTFTFQNQGSDNSSSLTTSLSSGTYFEIVSDNCNSQVLIPNNSCNIVVRPKATTDVSYSATLALNWTAGTTTATLSGLATGYYTYINATGGSISTDGVYKVHTFRSNGTFTVNSVGSGHSESAIVEYLVVAGGGGGGNGRGGGGGAGGYRTGTGFSVTPQAYTIAVGAGGAGGYGAWGATTTRGANGSDSSFSTITSTGGGGGAVGWSGDSSRRVGSSGGSGGGGGDAYGGGSGTSGQGGNGATGPSNGGGGGGGASGPATTVDGANGLASTISGVSTTYAGGGGGYINGVAGAGGGGAAGGASSDGTAGTANTGGGGGGGDQDPKVGGAGGSGIVIIRYKFQ